MLMGSVFFFIIDELARGRSRIAISRSHRHDCHESTSQQSPSVSSPDGRDDHDVELAAYFSLSHIIEI